MRLRAAWAMRAFLLVVWLLIPTPASAQPGPMLCVRPEIPTGLPGPTAAPPPARPFPCTRAQFEAIERDRARQQDLMARAAEAQRRQSQVVAAERETASEAARHPNPCARPDYASRIIEQTNLTRAHRFTHDRVVDIAEAKTLRFDPATRDLTCRATFITAEGKRLTGQIELRRNIAGEPIAIFTRDKP